MQVVSSATMVALKKAAFSWEVAFLLVFFACVRTLACATAQVAGAPELAVSVKNPLERACGACRPLLENGGRYLRVLNAHLRAHMQVARIDLQVDQILRRRK